MQPQTTSPEGILTHRKAAVDDDIGLVRLVQRGDRGAYEQVYRRNVGRVYALCLRLTADPGRAAELTQDVFVRAWQMIGSFRGESLFSSWLHRLAVNVVLVDMRTERRRLARVFPTDDLGVHDDSGVSGTAGIRMDLEKAILRLPPQARMVFLLHDVEGYRHEEIAEQMGIAVGTTKAQLHRARKLLKEVLES
jgi:RNA polymerase sigma-70 factor (ECF subfamily)